MICRKNEVWHTRIMGLNWENVEKSKKKIVDSYPCEYLLLIYKKGEKCIYLKRSKTSVTRTVTSVFRLQQSSDD